MNMFVTLYKYKSLNYWCDTNSHSQVIIQYSSSAVHLWASMKVLSILLIFIYALTADGGAPAISETFNATVSSYSTLSQVCIHDARRVVCAVFCRVHCLLNFSFQLLAQYIGGSAMCKAIQWYCNCIWIVWNEIVYLAAYILRDANAGKEYWGMYSVEENVYMGQLLDFGAKQSYNILQ